ncbi:MAG: DUF2281 domain-containing protein [Bacteroidota bacterium]|nr:DUF2281 domain-containing protein [Bacteroidota bacterium]
MEKRTITHQNIVYNLSYLPNSELQEVETFVKFLLHKNKKSVTKETKEPKTLAGIWKNVGFEKFIDLDTEITSLRKEMGKDILNKTFE